MFMSVEPADQKKEGRLQRHIRVARDIRNEPRTVLTLSRNWFVNLWKTKGGGFYGLGYVLTFVWLEARSLTGDIGASSDVTSFVAGQVFGYFIRFSIESFINLATAFIWPAWAFQWLGVWTIPLLIAGFLGFDYAIRPQIESWFPELRQARLETEARKRAKKAKKNAD